MLRQFVIGLLALCCLVLPVEAKTPGEVMAGDALREVEMRGLNGPATRLSEFRGKPLVINVWASWCGPCRQEMASLERLSRSPVAKDFQVIGISTDDYPDRAAAFLKQAKVGFRNYIDRNLELENMLGADHIPLTLLVDDKGRVIAKYYGAAEWDGPEAMRTIAKAFHLKPAGMAH